MIYVVEIQSRRGSKACKEDDAPTINAAWRAMQRDLACYPDFRIVDIRMKDDAETYTSEEMW